MNLLCFNLRSEKCFIDHATPANGSVCLILVYNDSTSIVTNNVESPTLTCLSSWMMSLLSLMKACLFPTRGWRNTSRYSPSLEWTDAIPLIMGLPGGFVLCLWPFGTWYMIGTLGASGNRYHFLPFYSIFYLQYLSLKILLVWILEFNLNSLFGFFFNIWYVVLSLTNFSNSVS